MLGVEFRVLLACTMADPAAKIRFFDALGGVQPFFGFWMVSRTCLGRLLKRFWRIANGLLCCLLHVLGSLRSLGILLLLTVLCPVGVEFTCYSLCSLLTGSWLQSRGSTSGGCVLLGNYCLMLAIGHWALGIGHLSLVTGCRAMTKCYKFTYISGCPGSCFGLRN